MIHLGVHIPIWGRLETVSLAVDHWEHLRSYFRGHIEIMPFAIVSPDDPDPYPVEDLSTMGWDVLVTQNLPLGRKWNAGWLAMRRAMTPERCPVAAFMQTGSDNLISGGYIEEVLRWVHMPRSEFGVDHVGMDSCFFVNKATGETALCTAGGEWGYGPGRLMSRHILDRIGWRPYLDKKSTRMDAHVHRKLEAAHASRHVISRHGVDLQRVHIVDIKDGGSKNTWDAAKNRREKSGEWEPIYRDFIPLMYPHLKWECLTT